MYSRQLYVLGQDGQRRMMVSSCLLIGLNGLGVEIAKNVVLAGVSQMTIVDPCPPTSYDLSANCYLQPHHLSSSSKSRASLCKDALNQLNPHVTLECWDDNNNDNDNNDTTTTTTQRLTADQLCPLVAGKTVCVVTVPLDETTIMALNEACRNESCVFVYTLACGVFGRVFCDFGSHFTVTDKDGETPQTSQIESILFENPAVIKVLEDQGRHGLETGDVITIGRLQSGLPSDCTALQESTHYTVKVTGPYTFELPDVDLSMYVEGDGQGHVMTQQGYITQVKQPVVVSHATYQERLDTPGEFMLSDFAKFDRPALLHLFFRALLDYATTTHHPNHNGTWPVTPGDRQAIDAVYQLAVKYDKDGLLSQPDNTNNKRLLEHFVSGCMAQLSPMCATLGGIVGQEVLKACSGKFTPINGFLYFDAAETLPDQVLPAELVAPQQSRYDSQIAVFGKDMQEKLLDLQYFIIGAGAIGCEMLKNWALMGVGCGSQGHVYVTDMDRIEKSNLSRQFLFRNTDIDKFKSSTAASAVKTMNPSLNITAYQEKVAPDTEHIFGDDFYDKLSGVCTALDNIEARLYVDQRCLFYRLPMLESGTLGTKGNTQVVVPHLTENYGATRDPPEKSIPVCTLKNFPNQITHTLQWARDWFEGAFKQAAEEVNTYLSVPQEQVCFGCFCYECYPRVHVAWCDFVVYANVSHRRRHSCRSSGNL